MRVVVDTNVLISAAIKAQTIPNIAVYRAAQRGVLLKSHLTEAELINRRAESTASTDGNGGIGNHH
jgi:predicted nucleic acid-binding protein